MTDRTAIGGNNPPPHIAHGMNIEDLFALVSGSTAGPVSTDDQEQALDALLDDVRIARKAADEQRAAEKRPHDEAGKAVQELWKPLLARCDAAADAIKAALTPYRVAKQRAKDEAARKAREEADARQRAAQDALRAAADLEGRFAAEEELKAAQKLNASANRAERAPTGLRTVRVATITDPGAFLRWVKQSHPDALKAWLADFASARVRGGDRQLPGVLITDEKRAA
jgi:chemotaxis protein histidine kinase CheA